MESDDQGSQSCLDGSPILVQVDRGDAEPVGLHSVVVNEVAVAHRGVEQHPFRPLVVRVRGLIT